LTKLISLKQFQQAAEIQRDSI